MIRHVEFDWDDRHGDCYECGNPAAYIVPDAYGPKSPIEAKNLRCSVCAAKDACEGERIVYLFDEDW